MGTSKPIGRCPTCGLEDSRYYRARIADLVVAEKLISLLKQTGDDLLRFVDAMPDSKQHEWYAVIQNFRDALEST